MGYKKHLKEKMNDPDFKREYEALESEFEFLRSTTSTLGLVIHSEPKEVKA